MTPLAIHQRSPIFLGSADDVTELENLYKELSDSSFRRKLADFLSLLASPLSDKYKEDKASIMKGKKEEKPMKKE